MSHIYFAKRLVISFPSDFDHHCDSYWYSLRYFIIPLIQTVNSSAKPGGMFYMTWGTEAKSHDLVISNTIFSVNMKVVFLSRGKINSISLA